MLMYKYMYMDMYMYGDRVEKVYLGKATNQGFSMFVPCSDFCKAAF